MYDQGPRVIVCTVVSCKHTGVQVLLAEGRGGGFFFLVQPSSPLYLGMFVNRNSVLY